MKKFTILVLMVAVVACHRKVVPASEPAPAPKETQVDVSHAQMVAQGNTVYTTRCGRCHALKPVENYTADRWTGILKSMIPKAKLTDAEADQVTAYVMENAKK
jgi:mono/diheme cytochrome c family protein